MGLDWCLKEKEQDGRKISPYESIGAKRLDKSDPTTIAVFHAIYDSHQEGIKETTSQSYIDFWSRPFEAVLDEVEPEHPILPETVTTEAGNAAVSGIAVREIDYRGKVVSFLLDGKLSERCYQDFTPEEMLVFANEVEAVAKTLDGSAQESLTNAVSWLRFWAEKGHGIYAWS